MQTNTVKQLGSTEQQKKKETQDNLSKNDR